jgi:hypothetical protein
MRGMVVKISGIVKGVASAGKQKISQIYSIGFSILAIKNFLQLSDILSYIYDKG